MLGSVVLIGMYSGYPVYPIDGFERTGIRRLERLRLILAGELQGRKPPPGARKSWSDVNLWLSSDTSRALPGEDVVLGKAVSDLFKSKDRNYSMALADITPGSTPRLALHRADVQYQPGSVGKLAIIAGLFTELASIFPDDTEARRLLLKSHMVTAGDWAMPNHHTIPVYDPRTRAFASRAVKTSDVFSLYEWADHAVSASSNAAASVLWKEVMLMRAFGAKYPVSAAEEEAFFRDTPKAELTALSLAVVNEPLRKLNIEPEEWRLGLMFTSNAGRKVPGAGGSTGTPIGLMKFLLATERGQLVDPWSSRETKRLMYATERRIRYAAATALDSAAVYYKSGSLYRCREEAGPDCGQYRGNVFNYMNSVAIVETTDGRVYLATLMSNVLLVNSASEHAALGGQIDRLVRRTRAN